MVTGPIPLASASSGRPASDDPYAVWATIGLATEVEEVGATEVRGTPGVAYVVTVPVDRKWLEAVGASVDSDEDLEAARAALGDVLRIDVVLDQQGRPLSLRAAGPSNGISFSWWDYDRPLDLQLPPESDVEDPSEYFGTSTNREGDTVERAAARLGGHELFTSLLPADATVLSELYCHPGTAWDGADCQMTYATGMSLAEVQRHYRDVFNGRGWQGMGDNRDFGRYIWTMAWRDETHYVNISIREPEEWPGDPVPTGTRLVITATVGERR